MAQINNLMQQFGSHVVEEAAKEFEALLNKYPGVQYSRDESNNKYRIYFDARINGDCERLAERTIPITLELKYDTRNENVDG